MAGTPLPELASARAAKSALSYPSGQKVLCLSVALFGCIYFELISLSFPPGEGGAVVEKMLGFKREHSAMANDYEC